MTSFMSEILRGSCGKYGAAFRRTVRLKRRFRKDSTSEMQLQDSLVYSKQQLPRDGSTKSRLKRRQFPKREPMPLIFQNGPANLLRMNHAKIRTKRRKQI